VNPVRYDAAWHAWLAETTEILQAWEAASGGRLTKAETADLVRRTAAALQAAAERTRVTGIPPEQAHAPCGTRGNGSADGSAILVTRTSTTFEMPPASSGSVSSPGGACRARRRELARRPLFRPRENNGNNGRIPLPRRVTLLAHRAFAVETTVFSTPLPGGSTGLSAVDHGESGIHTAISACAGSTSAALGVQ
jgi:hypothetical protein